MRRLAVLCCLLLCAACAGREFQRPNPGAIVLGKSTEADVYASVGTSPNRNSTTIKDGVTYKVACYSWAVGANSLVNGVTPARAMCYYFTGGVVVGTEFTSSFEADSTDFDTAKASAVVKGKTTRSDVIALFGPPGGECIHPLAKEQGQRCLVYIYSETRGTAFNLSFRRKRLIVTYGPDDVVTDVEMAASGPS